MSDLLTGRHLLAACAAQGWTVSDLVIHPANLDDPLSARSRWPIGERYGHSLGIAGRGSHDAVSVLGYVAVCTQSTVSKATPNKRRQWASRVYLCLRTRREGGNHQALEGCR